MNVERPSSYPLLGGDAQTLRAMLDQVKTAPKPEPANRTAVQGEDHGEITPRQAE
jgi:hypothetical protein